MATVRVFTAERMQEIEDTAITYAYLDGYNLILRRHNMQEINLGNIRGPQGSKGDTGEISEADLTAALTSLLANDKPWNTAWGLLDLESLDTATGALATGTHDLGMEVTFTPVAGRLYEFSARAFLVSSTAPAQYIIQLVEVGGSTVQRLSHSSTTATSGHQENMFYVVSGSELGAGVSRTYKLQMTIVGASTSISCGSTSGPRTRQLAVKDIGPA